MKGENYNKDSWIPKITVFLSVLFVVLAFGNLYTSYNNADNTESSAAIAYSEVWNSGILDAPIFISNLDSYTSHIGRCRNDRIKQYAYLLSLADDQSVAFINQHVIFLDIKSVLRKVPILYRFGSKANLKTPPVS
jgi:hypothetical protein